VEETRKKSKNGRGESAPDVSKEEKGKRGGTELGHEDYEFQKMFEARGWKKVSAGGARRSPEKKRPVSVKKGKGGRSTGKGGVSF